MARPPSANSWVTLLLGAMVLCYAAAPHAADAPVNSRSLLGVAPKSDTFLAPDVASRKGPIACA